MKLKLLLVFTFVYSYAFASGADIPLSTDVYKVSEIDSTTYLINDNGAATCYLLVGSEKALLVDTGIGDGNIAKLVSSITDKPVTLVNTHGHSDHIGANYQFREALINVGDTALYNEYYNPVKRPEMVKAFLKSEQAKQLGLNNIPDEAVEKFALMPGAKQVYIKENDIIDLGDRELEVVELPGHTAGSIMLIEKGRGYLYSGDSVIGWFLLSLPESLSVDIYYRNLCRLKSRLSGLSAIYSGHEQNPKGIDISYIDSIGKHIEEYNTGGLTGEKVEAVGRQAILYKFKDWRLYLKAPER